MKRSQAKRAGWNPAERALAYAAWAAVLGIFLALCLAVKPLRRLWQFASCCR